MAVVIQKSIFPPDYQGDLHFPQLLEKPGIRNARYEMVGHVEIDIFVKIPVEQVSEKRERLRKIVAGTHPDDFAEKGRVLQCDIYRMIAAQAAPGCYEFPLLVLDADKRDDLVKNILFILYMAGNSKGRRGVGVKTFAIDAVDTIHLNTTRLDLILHRVDDTPVFKIIEVCRSCREKYHRNALAAKDEHFHKPVQSRAKPFVIRPFHEKKIAKKFFGVSRLRHKYFH